MKWRATVLAQFYRRLQNELNSVRRDGVLYLSATELFDAPETARQLAPALSSSTKINDVLLGLGIRTELLRDQRGLVLLRPVRLAAPVPVAEQGIDFEMNRSQDLDEQFSSIGSTGRLIVHEPLRTRLPSFEAKSPFGKDHTPIGLASQLSPVGDRSRERFIHALATTDAAAVFDGGTSLPLGQEDSLQEFLAAYRRLPAGKFVTQGEESQPVTIRTLTTGNSTYAYLVNDSPWAVDVQLQLEVPNGCPIDELSGRRRLPVLTGSNWTIPMEPFDLVALQFRAGCADQKSGCAAGSSFENRARPKTSGFTATACHAGQSARGVAADARRAGEPQFRIAGQIGADSRLVIGEPRARRDEHRAGRSAGRLETLW